MSRPFTPPESRCQFVAPFNHPYNDSTKTFIWLHFYNEGDPGDPNGFLAFLCQPSWTLPVSHQCCLRIFRPSTSRNRRLYDNNALCSSFCIFNRAAYQKFMYEVGGIVWLDIIAGRIFDKEGTKMLLSQAFFTVCDCSWFLLVLAFPSISFSTIFKEIINGIRIWSYAFSQFDIRTTYSIRNYTNILLSNKWSIYWHHPLFLLL